MRLVRILSGEGRVPTRDLLQPAIILTAELTPSDTISLDRTLLLGFCTVRGGPMAHVAILARELGIPAVVGMEEDILSIPDGCSFVVDGGEETLLVEPDVASLDIKRE
jgi:phosphoenolpyruvate-protein kinase (PTS system EI component)